jgi:hypothetical protein
VDDLKKKIAKLEGRLEAFAAVGVGPDNAKVEKLESQLADAKAQLAAAEEDAAIADAESRMFEGDAIQRHRATEESMHLKWKRMQRKVNAPKRTAPAIDFSGKLKTDREYLTEGKDD